MTLIGTALAFAFLVGPWPWVALACLLAIDAVQLTIWWRWRKRRSIAGAEGIVGAQGVVVTELDPEGQVKAKGQIWKARSAETVSRGAAVQVVAVNGIELTVAPVVRSDVP